MRQRVRLVGRRKRRRAHDLDRRARTRSAARRRPTATSRGEACASPTTLGLMRAFAVDGLQRSESQLVRVVDWFIAGGRTRVVLACETTRRCRFEAAEWHRKLTYFHERTQAVREANFTLGQFLDEFVRAVMK